MRSTFDVCPQSLHQPNGGAMKVPIGLDGFNPQLRHWLSCGESEIGAT